MCCPVRRGRLRMYEQLNVRMTRNRVMLGLAASLAFAAFGAYVGQYLPPALYFPLWFVEIGMMVTAMVVRRRRIVGWTFLFAFTLLSGMTVTPILIVYAQALGVRVVEEAFFVTAGAFALSAFIASRRGVDFGWMGMFASVGLIGLLLLALVSVFFPLGGALQIIYTYLGISVFVGFMLFDLNRLTRYGVLPEQVPMMVLNLYLDFLNLFLFILQLLGLNVQARR